MSPSFEPALISGGATILVLVIVNLFASGRWSGDMARRQLVQESAIKELLQQAEERRRENEERHRQNEGKLVQLALDNATQTGKLDQMNHRLGEVSERLHDLSNNMGKATASAELTRSITETFIREVKRSNGH